MQFKFNKKIKISNSYISESSPVFIIGEAGVNHNGDMGTAKELIDAAVDAGVDAVKFQTFSAEDLILKSVQKAPYQTQTTSIEESQYDMLKSLEVTTKQNKELLNYCKKKNITFLTTPFDEKSLDNLDALDLPAYKIASTDLTNLLFLEKVAKKNKPIFLSTGMSYLTEIEMALSKIYPFNKDVILLQCTANYPIEDNEANLSIINTFKDSFNIMIGYSDHSVGVGAAPYSVTMGAKVVEKHFTLNKNASGPDHKASLSPSELKDLVKEIRKVEKYLGTPYKVPTISEMNTRASLQKCLVANIDIKKDDIFSSDSLIAKRTGGKGISPIQIEHIIGKRAKKDFIKDSIIEV